jgi:DNA-binding response OmpR family regulator
MHESTEAAVILVVEDRPEMRDLLRRTLREEGFVVHEAEDGDAGLARARALAPDLIILDVGLPGTDGFGVTQALRERGDQTPVLLLTARMGVADKVEGLDAGADDYLVKPFDVGELVARVRALLRRSARGKGGAGDARLRIGDLVVDLIAHEARRGARRLPLTQKEFALLELLVRNAGRPVTREEIAQHVWRTPLAPETNIVEVYVSYLRTKLTTNGEPDLLHTVRGTGYVLREP